MSNNQENIIQIQELISQISQQKIQIMNIDTTQTDRLFQITESLIKKNPISITNYLTNLIKIITKDKCIICTRQAMYMNTKQEDKKYCWVHSQILN
jgi:hypothetical protein